MAGRVDSLATVPADNRDILNASESLPRFRAVAATVIKAKYDDATRMGLFASARSRVGSLQHERQEANWGVTKGYRDATDTALKSRLPMRGP